MLFSSCSRQSRSGGSSGSVRRPIRGQCTRRITVRMEDRDSHSDGEGDDAAVVSQPAPQIMANLKAENQEIG